MSLLLKAFPRGRPERLHTSATVLVSMLAMLAVLLPLSGAAEARRSPGGHQAQSAQRAQPAARVGQPPRNYVIRPTSYFSFPNRSRRERLAIHNKVLATIRSVWGGRKTSLGVPLRANGKIRIATWSFDDWDVAKALVAAKKRGVSVQVVAAKSANKGHKPWRWLRKKLGKKLYRAGNASSRERTSFARQCRGSCRGPGGTPHSKFFLFKNVGSRHLPAVSVQGSANLTGMAYTGQWNHVQVQHSSRIWNDFMAVFREMRIMRPRGNPYHVQRVGNIANYFFPRPRARPRHDPVMQLLSRVNCQGATGGGTRAGRTKIRIIQYAIYGERGTWIAKKLRYLWRAGCNIAMIYALSSRSVLSILRSRAGRGAIPMKQSVIKDPWGNIVKYNHSKWMTITGRWARSRASYITFNGSANWSNLAFSGDEQMQRISSRFHALRHNSAFAKTWRQKTSRKPSFGRITSFGRTTPDPVEEEPILGEGIYKYMPVD